MLLPSSTAPVPRVPADPELPGSPVDPDAVVDEVAPWLLDDPFPVPVSPLPCSSSDEPPQPNTITGRRNQSRRHMQTMVHHEEGSRRPRLPPRRSRRTGVASRSTNVHAGPPSERRLNRRATFEPPAPILAGRRRRRGRRARGVPGCIHPGARSRPGGPPPSPPVPLEPGGAFDWADRATASRASSTRRKISRACSSSASPLGSRRIPRGVRSNSSTPSSSSSPRMRRVNGGCVTCNRRAALPT